MGGIDDDPLNDFCDACGAPPATPCRPGCGGSSEVPGSRVPESRSPDAGQSGDQRLLDQVSHAFAGSIHAKAALLDVGLSQAQVSRIREGISVDIRKYCDVVSPTLIPPLVSRHALLAAAQAGVDLCQHGWHAQTQFDRGRAHGTFHLEHVVPVSTLRQQCLVAGSLEETAAVLQNMQLAWILKEENRELDRLGFRSRRTDPDAAYQAAGIELLICPHPEAS